MPARFTPVRGAAIPAVQDIHFADATSTAAAVSLSVIRGHFEAIVDGRAIGWALDETSPSRSLEIEIWAEGALVAVGEASGPRSADLDDAGGTFSIALPPSLSDGRPRAIVARVSDADHDLGEIAYATPSPIIPKAPPAALPAKSQPVPQEGVPSQAYPLDRFGHARGETRRAVPACRFPHASARTPRVHQRRLCAWLDAGRDGAERPARGRDLGRRRACRRWRGLARAWRFARG